MKASEHVRYKQNKQAYMKRLEQAKVVKGLEQERGRERFLVSAHSRGTGVIRMHV